MKKFSDYPGRDNIERWESIKREAVATGRDPYDLLLMALRADPEQFKRGKE